MVVKTNGWTSLVDYPLADFGVEFKSELNIEDYFSFLEEYLILSDLYSICKIDLEGDIKQYLSYLRRTWKYFGILRPTYLPGYKYYSAELNNPFTLLAFYENGQIVQKEVCLIGNNSFNASYVSLSNEGGYNFYNRVNFNSRSSWNKNNLLPPLVVDLLGVMKGKKNEHHSITGSIKSDIWLDKVGQLKLWNQDGTEWRFAEEEDNSELALLNTPRLNSFLRGLKELGIKYGGEWFFESGIEVVDDHAIPINGKVIYS